MSRSVRTAAVALVLCAVPVRQAPATVRDLRLAPPDVLVHPRDILDDLAVDALGDGERIAAGDVNGDGAVDFVIGAARAELPPGADEVGAVHVLFGPLGAGLSLDLGTRLADVTILGPTRGGFFAASIAVGDVTGDGLDDIVAGWPRGAGPDGTRTDAGAALVVLGRAVFPTVIDLAAAPPDITIHGSEAMGVLGRKLAVGDVDSDGFGDVLAAAGGRVEVILGRAAWPGVRDLGASPADVTVRSSDAAEPLGPSALATGDLDDDGLEDVVIGDADGDGALHVLFGRRTWAPVVDLAVTPADVRVTGPARFSRLGSTLATGDVDGDGRADLLAGARGAIDDGRTRSGAAVVFLGRAAWPARVDLATESASVTILGPDSAGAFAKSVAVGDLDSDGIGDLVMGAPLCRSPDGDRNQAGVVHVVLGRSAWPPIIDLAVEPAALSVVGRRTAEQLGAAVATGDVSGDGIDDVLMGATAPGPFPASEASAVFGATGLRIACDPGGPYQACGSGAVVLDGSASSGPAPLEFLWSSRSPALVIADLTAPSTPATLGGTGPFVVELALSTGALSASCLVEVHGEDARAPAVECPSFVVVEPTGPTGALVAVEASVADDCDPTPTVTNSRTPGGVDATDDYPCGETLVVFSAVDAAGFRASCLTRVVVMSEDAPRELSALGETPLTMSRVPGDATRLRLRFADHGEPAELVNVYAGGLPPTGLADYDHAPIACGLEAAPAGPGVAAIDVALDAGSSHYYLVSASNCLAEGPAGLRSDGAPRPARPGACGPLE